MILLKMISLLLPWFIRRRFLNKVFGYEIHPNARIGKAWVFPGKLIMASGSHIDHFTTAIHLDLIALGENASIGRGNWITGLSTGGDQKHFKHQSDRKAALILEEAAAITKNHHLDCTNEIHIGKFTTIAGYQSQFLTHSIDIFENRQDSAPIKIGAYAFVGTNVVILGGSSLPAYSVLGAKSLLNKEFTEEYMLYGGVPGKPLQPISKEAKYFLRTEWFVY